MTLEELNAKYGKPTTPLAANAPIKRSSLADIVAKNKPEPSAISKVGTFLKGEAMGTNQKSDSLAGSIFQNTIGSRGVMGVAQLPGKVIGQVFLNKSKNMVSESQTQLAEASLKLMKEVREMDDSNPRKAKLEALLQSNQKTLSEMGGSWDELAGQDTTAEQAIGTGINAATTLAPFASAGASGLNAGAKAISNIDKIGSAATNLLKGKTIVNEGIKTALKTGGARAATTAVQGALIGTGGAMVGNKSAGDVAKEAIFSGIVGGTLSIANSIAKYGIHKVADSMAQSFVNSAIGPTKNAKIKDQILTQAKQDLGKTDKQTLAQKFLEKGKIGTNKGLIKSSIEITNDVGNQMDDVLKGSAGKTPISMTGVAEKFDDLINQTRNVLGDKAAAPLEALKQTYTSKGQSITAKEATQLYRSIYKILPDKAWSISNPGLVPAKEALRNVAGTLSDRVTKAVPAMRPLNFTYGMWKEVESNVLTREASKGLIKPLTEKIAAAAILPTTIANPVAGASLAAGLGVEKALTSTPVKLTTGFLLEKLANANLPQQVTEAIKQIILRGVSEENQNTTESDQTQ